MSVNDWGGRLAGDARKYIKAEAAGMGSIAQYVANDVMPYIGIRVQEGAYAWRPDSDECVKAITQDMFEAAGVGTVKGLKAGSKEWLETRNVQGFIRRAVALYRATCLLTAETGDAPEWNAGTAPRFPLAWFTPEGAELVQAKGVPTHAPISGKAKVAFLVLKEGEVSPHSCTVSEAAIIAASKPKVEKAADTPKAAPVTNLEGACEQLQSMLATADYKLSDKPADAFFAMLEAFIDASPDNAALVAGMAQRALADANKSEAVAA